MTLPPYEPMLARPGSLPVTGEWAYEMKWDGVRALAYVEDRAVRLMSRNGKDITVAYTELRMLGGAVGGHDLVLDGEIVAFDAAGRPSFGALQPRMHQRNPTKIAELVRSVPVTFMLFDLLHINAVSVVGLPYTDRRQLLEETVTPGARWQVPVWFRGAGADAVEASKSLGLEGVVAKRLGSPYRPGQRSADWTKVKNFKTQEVIICGWKPGEGRRAGMIGSLLLSVHDESGRLVFAGHVGTGFTERALADLGARLRPLERPDPPVLGVPPEHARDAHWVEPVLVGAVRYAEWTADGRIRHPSWRGLREDKGPEEVRISRAS
ncbi:non-homologous end-joining DNA ligase [Nonomuraea sp. NPDC049152]|uniref:non-homologous end-joining DNA ligase n=1 Tax=Nonomuraea sp. NPDC049152 TaxID=3154350 RepID=UPI0033F36E93